MPASESLQHDSMQNLVSRSFLFSLWWKEWTCFAVLIFLALLVAVRFALRGKAARRPATEKDILPRPPATGFPYRQGASSIHSRIEQPRRSIDVIVARLQGSLQEIRTPK